MCRKLRYRPPYKRLALPGSKAPLQLLRLGDVLVEEGDGFPDQGDDSVSKADGLSDVALHLGYLGAGRLDLRLRHSPSCREAEQIM